MAHEWTGSDDVGTDEAWANDSPKGKGWCPLLGITLLAGVLLTAYGAYVLVSDVILALS
jgi:hypothetical protein